jgi:hypothetical protein
MFIDSNKQINIYAGAPRRIGTHKKAYPALVLDFRVNASLFIHVLVFGDRPFIQKSYRLPMENPPPPAPYGFTPPPQPQADIPRTPPPPYPAPYAYVPGMDPYVAGGYAPYYPPPGQLGYQTPLLGPPPGQDQTLNVCLVVLSVLIPLAGWIIACAMWHSEPRTARACLIGASVSACVEFLVFVIVLCVVLAAL